MKRLLPIALLLGACSAAKPYGEQACTKLGWVHEVEQPASQEAKVEEAPESTGDLRADAIALKVRTKRRELDAREALISAREEKLKADVAAFEAARAALDEKEALAAKAKSLSPRPGQQAVQSTLALMPPKSAARMLEAMEDRDAARLVMTLPPQTVAEVFQAMTAQRAARLSTLISAGAQKPAKAGK